jgi:hypothetical protein
MQYARVMAAMPTMLAGVRNVAFGAAIVMAGLLAVMVAEQAWAVFFSVGAPALVRRRLRHAQLYVRLRLHHTFVELCRKPHRCRCDDMAGRSHGPAWLEINSGWSLGCLARRR